MGVDSGLPDFRGPEGFWRAYPPYKALGLQFSEMANPRWFQRDPAFAWGFYGHRLSLYRETVPHLGFQHCIELAGERPLWVFTSNVDGQFQRAGFPPDQIVEVHGSIHHLQCSVPCHRGIWSASGLKVEVDPESFLLTSELPRCGQCGEVARPNILMFGDGGFLGARSDNQASRYQEWLARQDLHGVVIVEMGAGTAVPTVRYHSERLQSAGATLIRLNPRESRGPRGTLSMPMGALEGLKAILGG